MKEGGEGHYYEHEDAGENQRQAFAYWAEEEEYWQRRHEQWQEAWTADGYRYFYRQHEDGAFESQWEVPEQQGGHDRDQHRAREEEAKEEAEAGVGAEEVETEVVLASAQFSSSSSSSSSAALTSEHSDRYEHSVESFTLPRRRQSPHYNLGSWEGEETGEEEGEQGHHDGERGGADGKKAWSAELETEKAAEVEELPKFHSIPLTPTNAKVETQQFATPRSSSSEQIHAKPKSKSRSKRSSKQPALLNVQLAIHEYHQRSRITQAVSPTAAGMSPGAGMARSPRFGRGPGSSAAAGWFWSGSGGANQLLWNSRS